MIGAHALLRTEYIARVLGCQEELWLEFKFIHGRLKQSTLSRPAPSKVNVELNVGFMPSKDCNFLYGGQAYESDNNHDI